jgi:hypothetical protein
MQPELLSNGIAAAGCTIFCGAETGSSQTDAF